MKVERKCPTCDDGVGLARGVGPVPGRDCVLLRVVCQSCGYEWIVEQPTPSDLPHRERVTTPPDEPPHD
jgi:hypothetical protein